MGIEPWNLPLYCYETELEWEEMVFSNHGNPRCWAPRGLFIAAGPIFVANHPWKSGARNAFLITGSPSGKLT